MRKSKKRLAEILKRTRELQAILAFNVTMCEIYDGETVSMAGMKTLLTAYKEFVDAIIAAGAGTGE